MTAKVPGVVGAKGWALLTVAKCSGWKRSTRMFGDSGMLSRVFAFVFAWLFYVRACGRVIASLIRVAVWRKERRAGTETEPIGNVDEGSKERVKIPPATAASKPTESQHRG